MSLVACQIFHKRVPALNLMHLAFRSIYKNSTVKKCYHGFMGDLGKPSFEAQMPSAGMHEEHSSYDV